MKMKELKAQRSVSQKIKLENYKNCLEVTQFENKITH